MDETSEATGPTTVGAQLRAAREARGQTLDEIGQQTRIPVRHLVQIESDSLEGLPAAPYSTGFVKAYARAVDLDPVALSQQFRGALSQTSGAAPRIAYEPYEPADPTRLPPRLLAIVALAIAVLLVAGYGIWRSGVLTGEGPDARARLAANGDGSAAPDNGSVSVPVPAKPVAAPVPVGGAVVLTALQPVWFKVSERDGATLFIGTLDQGKTFEVPATASDPVIRTGKPEAIGVTVGGQAVAPLGRPAHVISNVSLKADALRARPSDGSAPAPAAPTPRRTTAETGADTPTAAVPPAATGNASAPSAFRAADAGNSATPQP